MSLITAAVVASCGNTPAVPTVSESAGGTTTQKDAASTEATQESATTIADSGTSSVDTRTFGGYGDYSGLTSIEVPWNEAIGKAAQCAKDHGYEVTVVVDGVNFQGLPEEQRNAAAAVFEACMKAMNVPSWTLPAVEELELLYQYYEMALIPCLKAQGYEVADPPSRDTWVDEARSNEPPTWTVDRYLPRSGAEAEEIRRICPLTPAGGLRAWSPGDPITALPLPN